ncbi:MAG: ABC transporter permease [Acidobacteriota bacterium]|nr:ABC transporter permease [Acidobacteriota bacterium]
MIVVVKIAWRNLWRKPRRTILTVVTIALGLALLLVVFGIGDGARSQIVESAVRIRSGHVVVQQREYNARRGIDRFLDSHETQLVKEWIATMEEVFPIQYIVSRSYASGLASSSNGSAGVQLIGIDPKAESKSLYLEDKVVEGVFLDSVSQNKVVLGEGVAQRLSLKVGEKLVLMAQASGSSEIKSQLVRIQGILKTGIEEYDQTLVLMLLPNFQSFLNLEKGVHQIAIVMNDATFSTELSSRGKERFPSIEVLSWEEAMPDLADLIRVDTGANYVFDFVLLLLISFTVLNTLLMSVLERGREFALLNALGLTPSKRFFMILYEATFMAMLASVVGGTIGYGLHQCLKFYGLPIDLFYSEGVSAAGVAMDPIIYSNLSMGRILFSLSLIFIMTLGLGLIPAWRARRPTNIHILGRV